MLKTMMMHTLKCENFAAENDCIDRAIIPIKINNEKVYH